MRGGEDSRSGRSYRCTLTEAKELSVYVCVCVSGDAYLCTGESLSMGQLTASMLAWPPADTSAESPHISLPLSDTWNALFSLLSCKALS